MIFVNPAAIAYGLKIGRSLRLLAARNSVVQYSTLAPRCPGWSKSKESVWDSELSGMSAKQFRIQIISSGTEGDPVE